MGEGWAVGDMTFLGTREERSAESTSAERSCRKKREPKKTGSSLRLKCGNCFFAYECLCPNRGRTLMPIIYTPTWPIAPNNSN